VREALIQIKGENMEEKSICPKCGDGWLVKDGDRLVCSHCGEEAKSRI